MREIIKIFGQKRVIRLKNYSVSERAEEGLSSHTFISIFIFLTKIDFFGGGVALSHFLLLVNHF